MNQGSTIVITSIAGPENKVLQTFAKECMERDIRFIVIGDKPSPKDFHLQGCEFYGLEKQKESGFQFATMVPERHYSRKNIGYLKAIQGGSKLIVETDDDNFPRANFWKERQRSHTAPMLENTGWINVYKYFGAGNIWPRGYPLEYLQNNIPLLSNCRTAAADCPIQQGLADENPDVDAVYRLTQSLPYTFEKNIQLALGSGSWCPFNSQNTTFFYDAFPLLYLPSYCSFRMTDIWRSFVAQRICWENNWFVLFDEATVWQERNTHNLLRDFEEEIPGYLNNAKIAQTLANLQLKKGLKNMAQNLLDCYQALVDKGWVGQEEMELLKAWIADLNKLKQSQI